MGWRLITPTRWVFYFRRIWRFSNMMWRGSRLHISYTNFTFALYFRHTLKLLTRAGQCPSCSGTNFVRSFTRDWTWAQCCTFRVTPWSRVIQTGHTRRWTITEWRPLTLLVRADLQTTQTYHEVQIESCVWKVFPLFVCFLSENVVQCWDMWHVSNSYFQSVISCSTLFINSCFYKGLNSFENESKVLKVIVKEFCVV